MIALRNTQEEEEEEEEEEFPCQPSCASCSGGGECRSCGPRLPLLSPDSGECLASCAPGSYRHDDTRCRCEYRCPSGGGRGGGGGGDWGDGGDKRGWE
ncbi:hypothetical protein EYF80_046394 [Liparis tanakae]|uniref:Uncharacterized protein n=1 Tax=Liparis tanakae TaxID=230148 RepID=A0A4Z2FQA6_9TELE|nr:hypothetical protein EYF80_046394 [Liparis tanakae]